MIQWCRHDSGSATWTIENRTLYDRSQLRYPSDLTGEEWALLEPMIPPAKRGGGKRTVMMREVVNGVMYILSTGLLMAGASQRSAAAKHGAWLSRPLELGRNARTHPSCPLFEMPRKG